MSFHVWAAPKTKKIRVFVVMTQADLCPRFCGRTGPLALLCGPSALPAGLLSVVALQLPSVLARLSG